MAWLDGWSKRIELSINNYAGDIGGEIVWFPVTVFLKSDVWIHPDSTYDDTDDDGDVWWGEEFAIDGNTGSFAGTNTINEPLELRLDSPISCDKIRIFSDDYLDVPETYYDLDVKIEVYYSSGWHTIHDGTVTHSEYVTVEIGSTQTVSKAQVTVNAISGGEIGLYEFDFNKLQGSEVFAELTTDGEYNLMQFTEADGTTKLYGEQESFSAAGEFAIYHVSRDGWTINNNTSIFLYYDKDHAPNGDYIDIINTVTGAKVWNAEYKAVYHMKDGRSNLYVYDSTSNDNEGTKKAANQPLVGQGKVGQGQEFDGIDDVITHPTLLDVMPDDLTMEVIIETDSVAIDYQYIIQKDNIVNEDRISLSLEGNKPRIWGEAVNAGSVTVLGTDNMVADTWYYIAGVHTHDAALKLYLNTTEYTGNVLGNIRDGTYEDIHIGRDWQDSWEFDGVIDEVRISSVARNAAWLKGTKNTLWDDLFTYGSEESAPVEAVDNAVFFGCAF